MILIIIGSVLYLLFAILLFKAYCFQDEEYTLKSFYYALFFPITLIYQHWFNGGCLE
jgi:hypothetical protein